MTQPWDHIVAALARLYNAIEEARDSGDFTERGFDALHELELGADGLSKVIDRCRKEDEA